MPLYGDHVTNSRACFITESATSCPQLGALLWSALWPPPLPAIAVRWSTAPVQPAFNLAPHSRSICLTSVVRSFVAFEFERRILFCEVLTNCCAVHCFSVSCQCLLCMLRRDKVLLILDYYRLVGRTTTEVDRLLGMQSKTYSFHKPLLLLIFIYDLPILSLRIKLFMIASF